MLLTVGQPEDEARDGVLEVEERGGGGGGVRGASRVRPRTFTESSTPCAKAPCPFVTTRWLGPWTEATNVITFLR